MSKAVERRTDDDGVWGTRIVDEGENGGSQPHKGPYVFAFDDEDLSEPRDLFTPTVGQLLVPVYEYLTSFDDGEGGIGDARLFVALGDTGFNPADATTGGAAIPVEADIAPLNADGDGIVNPTAIATSGVIGFASGISRAFDRALYVQNAVPVTAFVADQNGDPLDPAPTQGLVSVRFLVFGFTS